MFIMLITMNWMIISNDPAVSKNISDMVKATDAIASTELLELTDASLSKAVDLLTDISHVVIIANSEDLKNNKVAATLCLISGYAVASKMPLFSTTKILKDFFVSLKDEITYFDTAVELKNHIQTNYKALLHKQIKIEAKRHLIDNGIPFTPNCFAQYIAKGKPEICHSFYFGGMDVNSRDDTGTPMLNVAVREDHDDLVSWLIEVGADINVVSEDRGYTPLMDAVWRGNLKVAEHLIKLGANPNTISKEGQSNLVLAVGANKKDIVKLLADNGADPDVKDAMGMSAWGYANLFRKQDLVEILSPYHKES